MHVALEAEELLNKKEIKPSDLPKLFDYVSITEKVVRRPSYVNVKNLKTAADNAVKFKRPWAPRISFGLYCVLGIAVLAASVTLGLMTAGVLPAAIIGIEITLTAAAATTSGVGCFTGIASIIAGGFFSHKSKQSRISNNMIKVAKKGNIEIEDRVDVDPLVDQDTYSFDSDNSIEELTI